ncbi:hypothetical protein DFJ77DRAFT_455499 [Powellomyces hirtus]|nr:hypothetical protein DFJ77DRAFT_455499 [Powellomyces hirtus]
MRRRQAHRFPDATLPCLTVSIAVCPWCCERFAAKQGKRAPTQGWRTEICPPCYRNLQRALLRACLLYCIFSGLPPTSVWRLFSSPDEPSTDTNTGGRRRATAQSNCAPLLNVRPVPLYLLSGLASFLASMLSCFLMTRGPKTETLPRHFGGFLSSPLLSSSCGFVLIPFFSFVSTICVHFEIALPLLSREPVSWIRTFFSIFFSSSWVIGLIPWSRLL